MSTLFKDIKDFRQEVKVSITIHDALMSGFSCMYFQDPSLLQFQERLKDNESRSNLQSFFGVEKIPKETQMREIIDQVDSEHFRSIFKDFYSRLQRGKHLEQFQIFPNMYYFPIDGSQFYSSKKVYCEQCLTKEHKEGSVTYSHQVLQGGIMHPDCSEIIPFMPEQIVNADGMTKQDCEMNAAKRFIKKLHKDCPQLGLLIGGDALFSKQPIIEDILGKKMHYLFVAKPSDHASMMDSINEYDDWSEMTFEDEKKRTHIYEWINQVPLNSNPSTIYVNFLRCRIIGKNKSEEDYIAYQNSWVTDLEISVDNVATLVRAGRCRWKNENECFNVMKNHGYYMERNYGHGQKHLAFNFYLLTLLAFFIHQISELTDLVYKKARKKFGSKKNLWEVLRNYIRIIIFDSWEYLLEFALNPKGYQLIPLGSSP